MTYRSLLVYVDRGLESDQRVALACELACRLDARLIGISGSAPEPGLGDPYMGGAMLGESLTLLRDCAETDVKEARARFAELTDFCAERTEWRGQVGYPAELVARAARAADLVIVGRTHAGAPWHNLDPADALMSVGRPVLVTPPQPAHAPADAPAIIAWKNTPEAQRAVVAALPFLRSASAVHVLELCEPDNLAEATAGVDDVVGYLERHGVSATAAARARKPRSTAAQILEFAQVARAGLIVAGGYGHARLREWALGGVTKALIAECPVCLLLTH
ncbi:MAG: universal stress protein [Brevundimonas sp.]|nr:MAG: universal stress protein [Brevundimonas sp.]